MKKILLSAVLLSSICNIVSAQNTSLPEPTTGSLSNYINTAVSPATGVPNIGIPIYQLESSNKEFPVNISLSYHVYNGKSNVPASEVGQGWSLFTSGVITRQVASDIDEIKDWTDISEEQADIFYYSIPGHSGKFKIYRDAGTGNSILINMTGEKIKIEYERELSGTKFIINSFTITDDNGFKYLFEDYNIGIGRMITSFNYKTSFVLTKVKDPGGNEIVSYIYDKKIKYSGTSTVLKKYQYCKINTISTTKGKLKFNYSYNAPWDDSDIVDNDPYTLNSISMTDPADRLQSRYLFWYLGTAFLADEESQNNQMIGNIKRRKALSSIQKLDKNQALDEETLFEYDEEGSSTQYGYYNDMRYGNYMCSEGQTLSPKKYTMGLLKKITFPTKGSVVYDFEANTVYLDRNSGNIYNDWETQYYEMTSEIPFDTNITNNYPLTVTASGDSYFEVGVNDFYFNTDPHGNPIPFSYEMRRSSVVLTPLSCGTNTLYRVFPAAYQFVTRGGAKGTIRQYTLKTMPAPYKNEMVVKPGARVKSIRSFDANGNLVKTKNYEYHSFANPENSSGEAFVNDNDLFSNSPYDGFMLYKNVKETEIAGTENNGYIKYYFKTPNDYVLPSNENYFPYFNLTSGGVMEKKEVYNSQNQLKESSDYEYSFQEIAGVQETDANNGRTKPSWLQYTKETAKTYLNSAAYQALKESTFSPDNFQEILTKSTTADGDITEVSTKYALEMNNTRFLTNNMISVPLQVETKSNGEIISRATTKYDNANHLYPTSLEVTDLAQVSETPATFDLYDDKGNLIQSTDKAGNSVVTIWGYHKTLPIAQITGAKYNDIISVPAIAAAITASDADADNPANEAALLTALENLRLDVALQQYPTSVNTYDPLVGVTNSVSANGIKQSYEYTASGKLYRVKNANGQLIKENQYNYKH